MSEDRVEYRTWNIEDNDSGIQEYMFHILHSIFGVSRVESLLEQKYRNRDLKPEFIKNAICGAPLSLEVKKDYLDFLVCAYPDNPELETTKYELECALRGLHNIFKETRFTVEDKWFDPDILEEKGVLIGVCKDCENIINCIKEDVDFNGGPREPADLEEDDWAGTTWYEVKKWDRLDNGKYANTYIYYFDGNVAKWFCKIPQGENKERRGREYEEDNDICCSKQDD